MASHGAIDLHCIGKAFTCALVLLSVTACDNGGTLYKASFTNDVEMARSLIAEGDSDVNARDAQGSTPLHMAAVMGSAEVARLLITAGANLEARNDVGTPLHVAVSYGQMEVVRLLIEAGASVNAQDQTGRTPLHEAVSIGKADIVSLVLERGAHVNARTDRGTTAMDTALIYQRHDIIAILRAVGGRCNTVC